MTIIIGFSNYVYLIVAITLACVSGPQVLKGNLTVFEIIEKHSNCFHPDMKEKCLQELPSINNATILCQAYFEVYLESCNKSLTLPIYKSPTSEPCPVLKELFLKYNASYFKDQFGNFKTIISEPNICKGLCENNTSVCQYLAISNQSLINTATQNTSNVNKSQENKKNDPLKSKVTTVTPKTVIHDEQIPETDIPPINAVSKGNEDEQGQEVMQAVDTDNMSDNDNINDNEDQLEQTEFDKPVISKSYDRNDESITVRNQAKPFVDAPKGSYLFTYLLCGMAICVLGYIVAHNKNKLLAFILEGRRASAGRGARKRHTASYRRLNSNIEEAITSADRTNFSQVIY